VRCCVDVGEAVRADHAARSARRRVGNLGCPAQASLALRRTGRCERFVHRGDRRGPVGLAHDGPVAADDCRRGGRCVSQRGRGRGLVRGAVADGGCHGRAGADEPAPSEQVPSQIVTPPLVAPRPAISPVTALWDWLISLLPAWFPGSERVSAAAIKGAGRPCTEQNLPGTRPEHAAGNGARV